MFSFNKLCSNTIPAGTYKAQITDVNFKTSSTGESSNDLVVHITITDGAYAKKNIIDTIYEKAFSFRLKPFLTACGVDMSREFNTAKELYEYGIKSAKGKNVLVEIIVKPYNGTDYNNVKSYMPLPGSTTSVEDVIAEFNTPMESLSNTPNLGDIPDLNDMEAPVADVSDEDLPF
jgi:hypothetical protein